MTSSTAAPDGPSGALLLTAKLRPVVRSRPAISRLALVERLHAKRSVPILIVSAPAGYGKSTMVAELASSDRRRSAWYSVDELDDEPIVFMTHLLEALRELDGDPDAHLSPVVDPSAPELSPAAVLAFAALPAPVLLVIDNVHHLRSPICVETLIGMAEAVPSGSQLVLITRSHPDRWLEKLDPKRVLTIDRDDLRLSDKEAQMVVAQSRMGVRPSQAEELNRRCAGWVTGVSLMLAVFNDDDEGSVGGVEGLLGADRFVREYFEVEVLEQLSEEDADFLLYASVLGRLTPDLCDAALAVSGSQVRLESLAKRGAFLERLEGEKRAFALHPLFAEMLEGDLRERDPHEAAALLKRAAAWCEERGDLESAIEYAIKAGELKDAAALATRLGFSAFRSGRIEAVSRWLAAVDNPVLLDAVPALAAMGASMLALVGRSEQAERWLRHLLAADPNAVMPDGAPAAVWAAGLRAAFCQDGVVEMRLNAEHARWAVPEESMMAPGFHLMGAVAELLSGDREAARDSFEAALAFSTEHGSTMGAALAAGWLALLALKAGDLPTAEARATEAVAVVEQGGVSAFAASAFPYAVSARVAIEAGRHSAAGPHAEIAGTLAASLTHAFPWLSVATRVELVGVRLAFGEPGGAHALLHEIDQILDERPDLGALVGEVAVLRRELEAGRAPDVGWESALTPAELRLLPLLAGHHSFREIAEQLGISRNTVKTQAIAVYRKLEVSSRGGAVERASELGLVAPTGLDLPHSR